MDKNPDPHGAAILKAVHGTVIFIVPPCDGEENKNGNDEKAKEKSEVGHGSWVVE